jgi:hypothetical protein
MKKTIVTLVLASVTLISTSAFIKSSNGIAGYTGAPGEVTCNTIGCHGGGSSPSSSIAVSSVPSFTNDEFVPGTSYLITIQLTATNFNRYGFGCEILNASNVNAGTMQNAGAGVKFLNSGGRKNAVHTTAKVGTGSASFSFEWVAPLTGDTATIYVAGNAVNGNGSTSGDFPIPPVFVQLKAQEPPPVSIRENPYAFISGLSVYPNPASGLTSISYNLSKNQPVAVQLVSLNGKVIREFINETQASGAHSHLLDLQNIAPGMYFVKTLVADQKVAQKMIAIH